MRTKNKNKIIAVLCSDLHLSLNPPRARKDESWFGAMYEVLKELKALAQTFEVPIICAGDIFDKWNSLPELINFTIENLPEMICIPGQHDLPLHNHDDIHKSAYWTLVKSGKIHDLFSYEGKSIGANNNLMLHGFSWEQPVIPLKEKDPNYFHLAVVHEYISMVNHDFPGCPKESRVNAFTKKLKGYDAAVFGDNHKGFYAKAGNVHVLNCGGFMRRSSDQVDYKPRIGLLHESGKIGINYLDTSHYILEVTESKEVKEDIELEEFLEELKNLQNNSLDFIQAMKEAIKIKKPSAGVKKLLLEAMEC